MSSFFRLIDDRDLNQQLICYHHEIKDHDHDSDDSLDDSLDDSPSNNSDGSDPASPVITDEVNEQLMNQLTETLVYPENYPERLIRPLTPIEEDAIHHFDQDAIAKLLPNLPEIEGRPQLGLFAQRAIPKGAVFLWRSDLGVRWRGMSLNSEQMLISAPSLSEEMNRRPLCRVTLSSLDQATEHTREVVLEAAQGASELQRSGPATLINFSWCHTSSVDAQSSPYRILPPHDLGSFNCHFASVIDPRASSERGEFRLCSAIVIDRPIIEGEQLLAFTGEGSSLRAVQTRRMLSGSLSLIAPALALAPWLRLFMSI